MHPIVEVDVPGADLRQGEPGLELLGRIDDGTHERLFERRAGEWRCTLIGGPPHGWKTTDEPATAAQLLELLARAEALCGEQE